MKSIILSVQPQWLAKILNGEKTIEIRKSAPKELPCEVYLYCTMGKPYLNQHKGTPFEDGQLHTSCILQDCPLNFEEHTSKHLSAINLNGKVVAKFTLNKVEEVGLTLHTKKISDYFVGEKDHIVINKVEEYIYDELEGTCLTVDELHAYGKGEPLSAWHIDNLVIFDKPMELGEFQSPTFLERPFDLSKLKDGETITFHQWRQKAIITRAPQSFCYCEPIK